MSLLDNIKVKLSPFHQEKVRMIDRFDYGDIQKKVSRDLNGVAEPYLKTGIENLKLYYVVALLDPLNRHAVSKCVDPFWHAHVLFTRSYRDFCRGIFGHYIHHEPLDPDDKRMVRHVARLYRYTLTIYAKMFKKVEATWWPKLDGAAHGPICYHMPLHDKEIMENAVFPFRATLAKGFPSSRKDSVN